MSPFPWSAKLPWSRWLAEPVVRVMKKDRRSKVWLIQPQNNEPGIIIKRFDYNPLRQRAACWLGVHPAQREFNTAERLTSGGLPVVPLLGGYVLRLGLGCRVHLATTRHGQSLQQFRRNDGIPDNQTIQTLLTRVGAIAVGLVESGWVFRDFKTSNLVVDEHLEVRLIDTGSARQDQPCNCGQGGIRVWRMLRMLDHTMEQDGWDVAARRHTLARALACLCPEPVNHAYDRLARIVLK